MSHNKEAELITSVLLYAIRSLAEGDQVALRNMKFGAKELDALRDLNLADLYRIDVLHAHCLRIELNRGVFWSTIDYLKQHRQSEELQQQLIVSDAPMEMMRTLFGMGAREYTRWRLTLTVDPSVGRPAELDEESNHKLWYAWESITKGNGECELTGEDYLALHQETGLPLRAIWILTQRWTQYGMLSPCEPLPDPDDALIIG